MFIYQHFNVFVWKAATIHLKKTKTTPPLLTWSTCYAGLLWTLFEGNENSVDPFYLQFCGTGSPTEQSKT